MTLRAATGAATGFRAEAVAAEAVGEALQRLGAPPNLALVFASPRLDLGVVLGVVRQQAPTAVIAGASTAGEISEQGYTRGGLSVMLIAGEGADLMLEHSEPEGIWNSRVQPPFIGRREAAKGRGLHASSTILLTDGLSACAPTLLSQLQNAGGSLHEIVGGAAGDESLLSRTRVGSDRRVLDRGAVALHMFTRYPLGIAIAEGFVPATPSMVVTRSVGNTLYELEGKPAFEAYQKYAETCGLTLSRETAGPFLLNNQLAVVMFQQVRSARAVVAVEKDGGLRCNGEIPQGSSVSILCASRDTLVRAARRAALDAKARLGDRTPAAVLLFSSVARQGTLRERYAQEIDAVKEIFPGVPLAGFLTYGEIARYSAKLEAWHNSSLVVAAIPS